VRQKHEAQRCAAAPLSAAAGVGRRRCELSFPFACAASSTPPTSLGLLYAAAPLPDPQAAPSPADDVQQRTRRDRLLQAAGAALPSPVKASHRPNKVSGSPGSCPPAKSGRRRPPIPPPTRSRPARGPNCCDCNLFRVFCVKEGHTCEVGKNPEGPSVNVF
jgi:hypothetical protein